MKVIIWGFKKQNTLSYVFNGYYQAFKHLGFETYWFDDTDDVSQFDFNNCLFLTTDIADKDIPLNESSKYILHHCNLAKYQGLKYINLCNYVHACTLGKSYNYEGGTVTKIGDHAYWDEANKALYQPWATNLLPHEFGDIIPFNPNESFIYYIGSVWEENIAQMQGFIEACKDKGKIFINMNNGVTEDTARDLVTKSYVAPDIRGEHHLNVGYIPCRIFKNISYGKLPATNSPFVRDFFSTPLPYAKDSYDIIRANEYQDLSYDLFYEVRDKHTFINRVNTILNII